jgi:hypothetical protein
MMREKLLREEFAREQEWFIAQADAISRKHSGEPTVSNISERVDFEGYVATIRGIDRKVFAVLVGDIFPEEYLFDCEHLNTLVHGGRLGRSDGEGEYDDNIDNAISDLWLVPRPILRKLGEKVMVSFQRTQTATPKVTQLVLL